MASESSDMITLKAHCHCKSNDFTIQIPKSSLPLRSAMCQCDTCRRCTGQLAANSISFPDSLGIPKPDASALSKLTEYRASAGLGRYFCPTCGAFIYYVEADCWDVMSGIVDRTGELLDRLNIWTDDTLDGGLSVWLNEINGKAIKCYRLSSRENSAGPVTEELLQEYKAKSKAICAKEPRKLEAASDNEKLHCRCRCGGVDFYVTRPDPNFPKPDPQWPERNGGLWWLSRGGKYKGCLDPCESCRRCTGVELNGWVYVPETNIFWKDGKPIQYNEGTLKTYQSTPGEVYREFCSICGATVFYRAPNKRKDTGVIDIAPGLLVGVDSRAEEWVGWESNKFWRSDALDSELIESVNQGIDRWYKEAKEVS